MPSFDFITTKEFRESLEADYTELKHSVENKSWKSAQVISGSIVECLLVDYLVANPTACPAGKNALNLSLGECVTACKNEGVISESTADLCSVIRNYRNLIHPGRAVRLGEKPPSKESATIANMLVDLILDEIEETRRKSVGLTAEQIISKIERDASAMSIVEHLLQEVSEEQRERLLIDQIPIAYFFSLENGDFHLSQRLTRVFNSTYRASGDETKKKAGLEILRVIREDDGPKVKEYVEKFFIHNSLTFLTPIQQKLIREHIFGRGSPTISQDSWRIFSDISNYMEPAEAERWVDPVIRTLLSSTTPAILRNMVDDYLDSMPIIVSDAIATAVLKRIEHWIKRYQQVEGNEKHIEKLSKIKADFEFFGDVPDFV